MVHGNQNPVVVRIEIFFSKMFSTRGLEKGEKPRQAKIQSSNFIHSDHAGPEGHPVTAYEVATRGNQSHHRVTCDMPPVPNSSHAIRSPYNSLQFQPQAGSTPLGNQRYNAESSHSSQGQLSRPRTQQFMELGKSYDYSVQSLQNQAPYYPGTTHQVSMTADPSLSPGLPRSHHSKRSTSSAQSDRDHKLHSKRSSSTNSSWDMEYPAFLDHLDDVDQIISEQNTLGLKGSEKPHHSQKRINRDEFDGPTQFLEKPSPEKIMAQDRNLPHVPITLDTGEQDEILSKVNDQLSQCAFDFIAKYQFPIPLEAAKRPVKKPSDREWTEWVYLLKRLATKRRIPARVLYNGQIKQLVTVLENSLEMRHASTRHSRPPRDDRNVLQLISAGTQVAKILKDATTMEYLDKLYKSTERIIQDRKLIPMTGLKR